MNTRASWVSVITPAVCAVGLVLLAAPAGLAAKSASATAAGRTATLTTGAGPSQGLRVATGDPRHPREPRLPRLCMVLGAELATTTGEFSTADKTTPPDTGRIQAALDRCAGPGRAS